MAGRSFLRPVFYCVQVIAGHILSCNIIFGSAIDKKIIAICTLIFCFLKIISIYLSEHICVCMANVALRLKANVESRFKCKTKIVKK